MPHVSYLFRWSFKLRRRARRSRVATMLILLSVIGILIAPFYLIYKPPAFLLRYFQWRWPDVLWRVSASSKIVALTIDDGPSVYTHEIMQILNLNVLRHRIASRRAREDATRSHTKWKRAGESRDARRAFAILGRCHSRRRDSLRGRNDPRGIHCR